jgi:hypothetical protein
VNHVLPHPRREQTQTSETSYETQTICEVEDVLQEYKMLHDIFDQERASWILIYITKINLGSKNTVFGCDIESKPRFYG